MKKKQKNITYIKVLGRIFLSEEEREWELGKTIEITFLLGDIIKREERDKGNGEKDVIWVIKPFQVPYIEYDYSR